MTLSPRKLATTRPSSRVSVPLLLGLAYCPAMRPIRTMGTRAPQTRISENERMSPILAVIFSYTHGKDKYKREVQERKLRAEATESYEHACTLRSFRHNLRHGVESRCQPERLRVGSEAAQSTGGRVELDLLFRSGGPCNSKPTSEGVTSGGKLLSFLRTLPIG